MTARRDRRVFKEIRQVDPSISMEDFILHYNEMILEFNSLFRTLNMASLNGEIITTTLVPGDNTIIHNLGVAPAHKVTLKLSGGDGFVKDVSFNRTTVILNNTGTEDLEITYILVKG
jgi:hypothetical protein